MADAKEPIGKLEEALRQYDNLVGVLMTFMTMDERRATLYDTLVAIEESVGALNDARLQSLYGRLVEGHRNFMPKYQEVLNADYGAFIQRLVKLATDAQVEANEADIALKVTLGLDASTGIWGPKGWRPPAE